MLCFSRRNQTTHNAQGVPFRETHHISGAAVKMSEDRGVPLDSLTSADLRTLHSAFEDDVGEVWDYETRFVCASSFSLCFLLVCRRVEERGGWGCHNADVT